MSEWQSTEEASTRLERTERTVRMLIERGDLHAERLGPAGRGGRWLVSAASVESLRAAWAVQPPRRGRPLVGDTPTPSALSKRRSRAQQKEQL